MKEYICPRCHKDHGPEAICGIMSKYCVECDNEMRGYTLTELYSSSKAMGIAAYMPYIPFYSTPPCIEGDIKMRELKFRFWCKSENRFVDDPEIDKNGRVSVMDGICGSDDCTNDIVVQQFTGLVDKAGKNIYEGDVVIHDEIGHSYAYGKHTITECSVELIQDKNSWIWGLKRKGSDTPMYNMWTGDEVVVVGNIFQYKK